MHKENNSGKFKRTQKALWNDSERTGREIWNKYPPDPEIRVRRIRT